MWWEGGRVGQHKALMLTDSYICTLGDLERALKSQDWCLWLLKGLTLFPHISLRSVTSVCPSVCCGAVRLELTSLLLVMSDCRGKLLSVGAAASFQAACSSVIVCLPDPPTDALDFSDDSLRVLAGGPRRPPPSKPPEKNADSFRRIFSAQKKVRNHRPSLQTFSLPLRDK